MLPPPPRNVLPSYPARPSRARARARARTAQSALAYLRSELLPHLGRGSAPLAERLTASAPNGTLEALGELPLRERQELLLLLERSLEDRSRSPAPDVAVLLAGELARTSRVPSRGPVLPAR